MNGIEFLARVLGTVIILKVGFLAVLMAAAVFLGLAGVPS